jgi:hypothetical protein
MRALAIGLCALCASTAPASSWADTHKDGARRSARLYQEGRFAEALAELKAAYALTRRTELLYAMGQASRLLGDYAAAIGYYQEFTQSGASPEQVSAAVLQIGRCRQLLSRHEPASPAVVAAGASPEVATTANPVPTPEASGSQVLPPKTTPPPPGAGENHAPPNEHLNARPGTGWLSSGPPTPPPPKSRGGRGRWIALGVALTLVSGAGLALGLGLGLTSSPREPTDGIIFY